MQGQGNEIRRRIFSGRCQDMLYVRWFMRNPTSYSTAQQYSRSENVEGEMRRYIEYTHTLHTLHRAHTYTYYVYTQSRARTHTHTHKPFMFPEGLHGSDGIFEISEPSRVRIKQNPAILSI